MNYLEELAYSTSYDFNCLNICGHHKEPTIAKSIIIWVAVPTDADGYNWQWIASGNNETKGHSGAPASTLAKTCIYAAECICSTMHKRHATFQISLSSPKAHKYVFYTRMHEVNGMIGINIVLDPSQTIRTPAIKHFIDYLHDACKIRNEMLLQDRIIDLPYPVEAH